MKEAAAGTGFPARAARYPVGMSALRGPVRALVYLWAFPTTLIGLAIFLLARIGGARASVEHGVLEVHGPGIRRVLAISPVGIPIQAITFGHVVLGCDRDALKRTRAHERAHVEQCQRWGPAFVPAYLLASLYAWLRGGDAYWDNPFERQARAAENAKPRPTSA